MELTVRGKTEGCEGIRPQDLNYCASVVLIDFFVWPMLVSLQFRD